MFTGATLMSVHGGDLGQRFQYYNLDPTYPGGTFHDDTWRYQIFSPQIAHNCTGVVLWLSKLGTPGTLTVSLRAVASNKPTGGDLAVGTINGNDLPLIDDPSWEPIQFGTPYAVTVDTEYAIVVRALTGGPGETNLIRLAQDSNDGAYARGVSGYSTNGGGAWTVRINDDNLFEEWGTL